MSINFSDTDIQQRIRLLLPGTAVIAAIGMSAFLIHMLPFIGVMSVLIISILLGMMIGNLYTFPDSFRPGVKFGLRRVLRIAVAMLGLQLSITQVQSVGLKAFFIVALTLTATFLFTTWLGKIMGIEPKLTQLIAAGTSICGASAIAGVNTVTKGSDTDVAYSIGTVTLFGTISMFAYPLLAHSVHLSQPGFGLWAGSSIHEVAQVVAAAFQEGNVSGQVATVSKLSRVLLLAPVIVTIGLADTRRTKGQELDLRNVTIPWFVVGFLLLVGVNSLYLAPQLLKNILTSIDQILLAVSMAAMGLETRFSNLARLGLKPLLLAAGAWLFISTFSLSLILELK